MVLRRAKSRLSKRKAALFLFFHLEVHANLEELGGGQVHDGHAGARGDAFERGAHVVPRGADEREPDVEFMVAQVVVGDSGQGIHIGDELLQLVFRHLGPTERRAEAQFGGLEVRAQTADDAALLHGLHAFKGFLLGNAELFAQHRIGARHQRKRRLDDVEKLLIDNVEFGLRHGYS